MIVKMLLEIHSQINVGQARSIYVQDQKIILGCIMHMDQMENVMQCGSDIASDV